MALQQLIDDGVLEAGEKLVLFRQSAPSIEGELGPDGSIMVGATRYATPSAAARHTLGTGAVDGWLRWRVPRLGDCHLASLREAPATTPTDVADAYDLTIGSLGGEAFGTVLADPPWRFQNRTGKVAPEHRRLSRYDTMAGKEIAALPVADVMAKQSHCYLWVPNALIAEGLDVMEAWGFTYKAMLVWAKRRKDGGPDGRGVGFYFRNVTEPVLFGVRGKLRTQAAGRRQVNMIETRKREHSRKPDELYPIIEACSPGPRLELFARYPRDGWAVWGNESAPEVAPRGRQHPMYRGAGG